MDSIINAVANYFGVDPGTLVLALGILVAVANLVGKQIPSSATGALGIVRKVCLVIGLYVPQKVTANVSTKNVAEAMAATLPDEVITSSANRLPSSVQLGMEAGSVALALKDAIERKTDGRPYVPGESPEPGSTVPDEYRTDGPFAAGKDKFK